MLISLAVVSCQEKTYREHEIVVVVTPVARSATVKTTVTPLPATREEVRERWRSLERVLASQSLTIRDLSFVHPAVYAVQQGINSGDPQKLMVLLGNFQQTARKLKNNRTYLIKKLEKTEAAVQNKSIPISLREEYLSRLQAVPRLIEEEKFALAYRMMAELDADLQGPDVPLPHEVEESSKTE